jgi:PAS domain S-box-containing protein
MASGESYLRKAYFSRHQEDRARTDKCGTATIRAGRSYSQEYRCQGKDGQWYWHHDDVHVETIASGRWNVVVVTTDITERKQAEEEMRHIMSSALCLFWSAVVTDVGEEKLQWRIAHYDEESAQRFLPLEVAPGDTYMHTAYLNRHPDDVVTTDQFGVVRVRAGQSYAQEFRCKGMDGQWHWHHEDVHVEPIAPNQWHVVVVTTDITERMRAEQARYELQERFHVMADTAPVMIWMAGTDAQLDWFNQAWLDFTGRSLEQEVEEGWMKNIDPSHAQRCLDIYRDAFARREPFRMEYRMRRHDGVYRWFLDSGRPRFTNEDGKPSEFVGYIGCCVDVTEKHDAEQERASATRQQQAFLRDVLISVTEGHLYLCATEDELPVPLSRPTNVSCFEEVGARGEAIQLTTATLSEVRRQVRTMATLADFPDERMMGLMSAASECAMNAVTHGGEYAEARVLLSEDGSTLQVWVQDQGSGIDVSELPKATLMKGYSGAGGSGGFGHGFFLMLQYIDRIYLLTGPQGTTVVIEQGRIPPPDEFDF